MGHLLRSKAFPSGGGVAWLVDREAGYREAAPRWRLEPFASLPGGRARIRGRASINVATLAGLFGAQARLEPARWGDVRVVTSSKAVVQPVGASTPRAVGGSVVVDCGTVVRIDSLLVAPLDARQAEAFSAGRLLLPIIGIEAPLTDGDPELDDDVGFAARLRGHRRLARIYALTFLVVGLASLLVPALLWTDTAQWVAPLTTAYDRALVDLVAWCVLSIAGSWSLLALVGLAFRRRLGRWATRSAARQGHRGGIVLASSAASVEELRSLS